MDSSPLYAELVKEVDAYASLIKSMYVELSKTIEDKNAVAGLVYEWFQTQMQKDLISHQSEVMNV